MESERMLHPFIDNKGVEIQNEVVKEEKNYALIIVLIENGMNSTSNFGSYKDFYGILMPETIQASKGPQKLTFKLVNMDLNGDFSSTDFE